jgi:cell division protein FtsL
MKTKILYGAVLFLLALAIPGLLALDSIQGRRFTTLEREVTQLEKKQVELVESNRKLITGISVLSSSDRIEKIAEKELGMRKAESSEIVRIEMKKK